MQADALPSFTHSFPFGESALERIFAHLEKFDPELNHFAVTLIGLSPRDEPYASLDQAPSEYSSLRDEITLPPPPPPNLKLPTLTLPPLMASFAHLNRHEVGTALESLHHPTMGGANYHTYACLVFFHPGYYSVHGQAASGPAPRIFHTAPAHPCACLMAVCGNRIAFYAPAVCNAYVKASAHLFGSTPVPRRGVDPNLLFPYLFQPRWALDRFEVTDIILGYPDDASAAWIAQIETEGVSIPENPRKLFDGYALQSFRKEVFDAYADWYQSRTEFRHVFDGKRVHPFKRAGEYLETRYESLRDWMNHAVRGIATPVAPTWNLTDLVHHQQEITELPESPRITDDLAGEANPGSDQELPVIPIPIYYPNWLAVIVQVSHIYLSAYFNAPPPTHTGAVLPTLSTPEIQISIENLLYRQGLLRALLTDIGAVSCADVQKSRQDGIDEGFADGRSD